MSETAINILRIALVNAIIKDDPNIIASAKAMLVRRLKQNSLIMKTNFVRTGIFCHQKTSKQMKNYIKDKLWMVARFLLVPLIIFVPHWVGLLDKTNTPESPPAWVKGFIMIIGAGCGLFLLGFVIYFLCKFLIWCYKGEWPDSNFASKFFDRKPPNWLLTKNKRK